MRMCDMTRWYVGYDSLTHTKAAFVSMTWLVDMCAMTHTCLWHVWGIRVPWLIRTCDMTLWCVCHDSTNGSPLRMPVSLLIRIRWAMTHAYLRPVTNTNESCHTFANASHVTDKNEVCHDSCVSVTSPVDMCAMTYWFIRMCAMTHSYVCHDSFVCVTWLVDMFAMTHSYVWHDSFTCAPWLIDSFVCDPLKRHT